MNFRQMALLALAGLALAACGKGASTSDPKASNADWMAIEARDKSCSLQVPKDWTSGDPQSATYKEAFASVAKSNPQLQNLSSVASQVLLLALSTDKKQIKSGFIDNVNVNRTPGSHTGAFTDQEVADAKKQLTAFLPLESELKLDKMDVPAGPALHYTAALKISGPNGQTIHTHTIGYMVPRADGIYVVTFTTIPDRTSAMDVLADQSIKTLTFR